MFVVFFACCIIKNTFKNVYLFPCDKNVAVVRRGIHSGSDTNMARTKGLCFNYSRLLLYCPGQMLAVIVLSQHRVLSSRTVRPRAPSFPDVWGTLLEIGLRFVLGHHTCNAVKERMKER